MPRKRVHSEFMRRKIGRERAREVRRRQKAMLDLGLDRQAIHKLDERTPNVEEPIEPATDTCPASNDLMPDNDCQTKFTSDSGDRIFKYYDNDMHSRNEESDSTMLNIDIVPKFKQEYMPKKYQTVLTNQNPEKKRTRGRPSKYSLEWESATKSKEYDPKVVQCCVCFRNLLFGCNGQKVFKKHRHFETNNIICSSCQQVSDVNTLTTNTCQSQNTYEKLEHSSEMSPGSIKPVTKVVYVVRPPSEVDKLIIKKPRVYRKRRTQTPAQVIDDLFESTSCEDVNDCIEGDSSSNTNMKPASTSTTHIWSQSNSIDNQTTSDNDDDDDDDDDDDSDERYSSRKLFVKLGKPKSFRKRSVDLQSSTTLMKCQETDKGSHEPALIDNYLQMEIKREPVDPEYELFQSNSSFEKNCDVEVKIENVDQTHDHFSPTSEGTVTEYPLHNPYVNEDHTCVHSGIGKKKDNFMPTFDNSGKDPCSSKHFHQTNVSVGSAEVGSSVSQDMNKDLAYIYLSNRDDASLPKPSLEGEGRRSPGEDCVAVIPVFNAHEYIKKEMETE